MYSTVLFVNPKLTDLQKIKYYRYVYAFCAGVFGGEVFAMELKLSKREIKCSKKNVISYN